MALLKLGYTLIHTHTQGSQGPNEIGEQKWDLLITLTEKEIFHGTWGK